MRNPWGIVAGSNEGNGASFPPTNEENGSDENSFSVAVFVF